MKKLKLALSRASTMEGNRGVSPNMLFQHNKQKLIGYFLVCVLFFSAGIYLWEHSVVIGERFNRRLVTEGNYYFYKAIVFFCTLFPAFGCLVLGRLLPYLASGITVDSKGIQVAGRLSKPLPWHKVDRVELVGSGKNMMVLVRSSELFNFQNLLDRLLLFVFRQSGTMYLGGGFYLGSPYHLYDEIRKFRNQHGISK